MQAMVEGRHSLPQRPSRQSSSACSLNSVVGLSHTVDEVSSELQRPRAVCVVRMRSTSPLPAPSVPLQGAGLHVRTLPLRRASHSPTGSGQIARSNSTSFRPDLGQDFAAQSSGATLWPSASARVLRAVSPGGVRYRSSSPRSALTGGASPHGRSSTALPSRTPALQQSNAPTPQASLSVPCGNSQLVANSVSVVGNAVSVVASGSCAMSARARAVPKQEAIDTMAFGSERQSGNRRPSNVHSSSSNLSAKAFRIASQPAIPGSSTTTTASSGSLGLPPGPTASPKLGVRKSHQAPQPSHCIDPLLARTPLSGPKGKKLRVSVLANRLRSVGTSWEPPLDATSSLSSDWRNDLRPISATQGTRAWTAVAASSSASSPSITGRAVASSSGVARVRSSGVEGSRPEDRNSVGLTSPVSEVRSPHLLDNCRQVRQREAWHSQRGEDSVLHVGTSVSTSSTSPAQSPAELCRLPTEVADVAHHKGEIEFLPRLRVHSINSETSLSEHSPHLSYAEVGSPPRSARAIMAKPLVVLAGSGSYAPVRQTLRVVQACSRETSEDAVESDTRPPSSERLEVPSGDCTPPCSARARPLALQGTEATCSEVAVDRLHHRLAVSSLWEPTEVETTIRRSWQVE